MAMKKKAAAKSAKKPVAMKPVSQALSKSGLVSHIATHTGVDTKSVRAVLEALEQTIHSSIGKKGAGTFTMPGTFKMSSVAVAAKPKRKGIDPFTKEERWFAAKPASVKVKIRALKKLKDAAL
jgi:nucleoid DNA-binding protein